MAYTMANVLHCSVLKVPTVKAPFRYSPLVTILFSLHLLDCLRMTERNFFFSPMIHNGPTLFLRLIE